VHGVTVSGDYAYAVGDYAGSIFIVDVSDKTAPTLAGSYSAVSVRGAAGVAVSGDYAYVTDGGGILIVDVSNKSAPMLAGRCDTAGTAHDAAVSGDYAYVADGPNGLVVMRTGTDTTPPILTITSPTNGTTVTTSTITISGTASDESGIANVTVNAILANGTTNWSAEVTLTAGENTITVVATDGAGLNTTETITVWCEPLRGDLDHDGTLTPTDAVIALEIAAGSVTSLDALMILQAAVGSTEIG